jgi:hypothetical protein
MFVLLKLALPIGQIYNLLGMQGVGSIKGAVAAWISNYYLSQNTVVSVQFSGALDEYACGQYVLN